MDRKAIAILLGGVIPGLLLGIAGAVQKVSATRGLGAGPFLVVVGATTAVVGGVFMLAGRDVRMQTSGVLYAALYSVVWATAVGCITLALGRYGGSVSQLAPLYSMNTIIVVAIGLVVLSEWRIVNVPRVLLASALVIAGGILATRS